MYMRSVDDVCERQGCGLLCIDRGECPCCKDDSEFGCRGTATANGHCAQCTCSDCDLSVVPATPAAPAPLARRSTPWLAYVTWPVTVPWDFAWGLWSFIGLDVDDSALRRRVVLGLWSFLAYPMLLSAAWAMHMTLVIVSNVLPRAQIRGHEILTDVERMDINVTKYLGEGS